MPNILDLARDLGVRIMQQKEAAIIRMLTCCLCGKSRPSDPKQAASMGWELAVWHNDGDLLYGDLVAERTRVVNIKADFAGQEIHNETIGWVCRECKALSSM